MEIGIDDIKLILDGKISIKEVLENKKIHLENSKDNIEIIQERIKTYLERKKVYLFFDNEEKRDQDITSYFDTSPRYIEFYISDERMSFENINILYEDVHSIDVSICVSKAENGHYYGIHNLYFIIVNINTKEYCHTLEIMNNNKINRFFDVIKEKDIKVNDPMGLIDIYQKYKEPRQLNNYLNKNYKEWQKKYHFDEHINNYYDVIRDDFIKPLHVLKTTTKPTIKDGYKLVKPGLIDRLKKLLKIK